MNTIYPHFFILDMKPTSNQFLQKMREKYPNPIQSNSIQALPIRANEHLISYNRFSQRESVLEGQITKSDTFCRDRRVTEELHNISPLAKLEYAKQRKFAKQRRITLSIEEIPLPSDWNPEEPITNTITKIFNFTVRPFQYAASFHKLVQRGLKGKESIICWEYPSPNVYPNTIVYNDFNKRMRVVKVNGARLFRVSDIMGVYRENIPTTSNNPHFRVVGMCIHAVSSPLIIGDGSSKFNLPVRRSVQIQFSDNIDTDEKEKLNDVRILPARGVAIFAIEYFLFNNTINPFQTKSFLYVQSDLRVSEKLIAQRASFLRKVLPLTELQSRLRFLDAEFARDDHKKFHVVSVVIMDYNGQILLNTLAKPRAHIDDWCDGCHGITETDIIGQPDEYEVINAVHRHLFGNILIGHDLQMEIRGMALPVESLLGIRDTAAAPVFKKFNVPRKGDFYKLKTLSRYVLQRDIQSRYHIAEEDVSALLDIYKKVEPYWEDTISSTDVENIFTHIPNSPPSPTAEEWISNNSLSRRKRLLEKEIESLPPCHKSNKPCKQVQDVTPAPNLEEEQSIQDKEYDPVTNFKIPFTPIKKNKDTSGIIKDKDAYHKYGNWDVFEDELKDIDQEDENYINHSPQRPYMSFSQIDLDRSTDGDLSQYREVLLTSPDRSSVSHSIQTMIDNPFLDIPSDDEIDELLELSDNEYFSSFD